MVINVGINGFGRIGRIVSRACLENSNIQLSAINDPAITAEYICYLIKFDSTHGKLNAEVTYDTNGVIVNDLHIKVYHEKQPASVPWHSAGVQYVVEASGMFTNYDKAKGHLESGSVKRVIVTAPSVDVPMIILGVNDDKIDREMQVISCASSTLYCLAPLIKVLDETFGVEEGFVTSIHAMTPSLKPLDGLCLRGKHWRDHRSIHQNIIPATTGACKALGKILPQVKDKLSGLAFRVPIVNVSVLDLTIRLNTLTTLQDIVKAMASTSKTSLDNIIKISSEETVSSDFIGETHSCIFDADASIQLNPNFFKIICWYENEYSYACRVIDTILFCEKQEQEMRMETPTTVCLQKDVQQIEHLRKSTMGDGNIELHSNIPTTRSDLGKSVAHRSLALRKPTATVPSLDIGKDPKKRSALFKVWNDTKEPVAKQNKTAFFQSCMMFTPSPPPKKIDCFAAQEHLESVKREFSKMVNITEDLLKKTHSNQSSIRSLSIEEVKGFDSSNNYFEIKDSASKHDVGNNGKYGRLLKNGDGKSLELSNETLESIIISEDPHDDGIRSKSKQNLKTKIEEDFHTLIKTADLRNNSMKHDKPGEKLCSETFCINTSNSTDSSAKKNSYNNNQKEETYMNSSIGKTTQRKDIKTVHEQKITRTEIKNIIGKFGKTYERNTTVQEITGQILCSGLQIPSTKLDFGDEDVNNTKLVDQETRKRNNMTLIDNHFVTGKTNFSDNLKSVETKGNVTKNDIATINLEELKNSSDLSKAPNEEQISEVTDTNSFYKEEKQDIYDKLDSASASGSNNSFEINERKSQVIQIADITNSLDDLARLDKICRIIEISDELSDNLFSALDDNRDCDLKRKKWSFRDLCDRIKLDEFCNKVFGRNAR